MHSWTLIHASGRMHTSIEKICTNKHVYILTRRQTSGKNRITERKANIRPECTCTQMDRQIDASCHSAKDTSRHRQQKGLFHLPWRAFPQLTNLRDAKTNHVMEVKSEPPPPRSPHLLLYVPTCAPSSVAFLAGYSENIEWKIFSIEPVSHLGERGIWMERAAWLQTLILGCYDRASGWEFWRVSSRGLFLQHTLSLEELPTQQLSDLQSNRKFCVCV